MLHPCKQRQLWRGCKINNEVSSSFKYYSQNILDCSWGSTFYEYTIMKTFKQFMENLSVTPKMYDDLQVTIDDAITNKIRTLDTIDKSNRKFRKDTGFNLPLPLAKKKTNKKVKSA